MVRIKKLKHILRQHVTGKSQRFLMLKKFQKEYKEKTGKEFETNKGLIVFQSLNDPESGKKEWQTVDVFVFDDEFGIKQ